MNQPSEFSHLFEALGIDVPPGLEKMPVDLIREELRELLEGSTDRRKGIHTPPLVELATLKNGSCIMAIDYTQIPGGTSKSIPMDHEFIMAEERGEISLEKTPTLIVHSSGNASIWFTEIARKKGYNVIVVTFDYASTPRIDALSALGANIHFVPGELGVEGIIAKAKELEAAAVGSKFLDQTHSRDNFEAFKPQGGRAARKLLLRGKRPTHLVAGVGTGGTFTGLSLGVRELVPECECVAVEISGKPYLSTRYKGSVMPGIDADRTIAELTADDPYWIEEYAGASQVPGMAANIGGMNLTQLFEESGARVVAVENKTGLRATRLLAMDHQRFLGPSTGTTFAAALAIAQSQPNAVVLMPICDDGFRYEGDLWHKEKYHVQEVNAIEGFVGSTLTMTDRVQANQRTPHLVPREMGGPLSTDAMIYFLELTCRELEKKLGLIDDERESLGMGFVELQHKASVPLGTALISRTKLVGSQQRGNKHFLEYEVQLFAIDKTGREVPVSNATQHKRCVLSIREFRQEAAKQFSESSI